MTGCTDDVAPTTCGDCPASDDGPDGSLCLKWFGQNAFCEDEQYARLSVCPPAS